MNTFRVSCVCPHHTDRVEQLLCSISVLHSMMLLPYLQCYYLLKRREKKRVNCWWTSFMCLFLSSQLRLSSVSVVFDFNASLNDVAPIALISLSVNTKKWFIESCLLCASFFVFTIQIECSECCVWFQWFTQWCCSSHFNTAVCRYGKELFVHVCLWCVYWASRLR